jgi:hypothetical protein
MQTHECLVRPCSSRQAVIPELEDKNFEGGFTAGGLSTKLPESPGWAQTKSVSRAERVLCWGPRVCRPRSICHGQEE